MNDEALPPLGEILLGLAALDSDDGWEEAMADAQGTTIERMGIAFPIELDVRTIDGGVTALGASPPTQYTETTIMPVFHHLRVTLGIHDEHPA